MLKRFIESLSKACNNSIHSVSIHRAFYIALNVLGKKVDDEGALDTAWSLIRIACATGRFMITRPNCFGNRFVVAK
jgi:hypothetical protein